MGKILPLCGVASPKTTKTGYLNPTAAEILLKTSNPEYYVMLRHEASATDETDASRLSMTEIVFKRLKRMAGLPQPKSTETCFSNFIWGT